MAPQAISHDDDSVLFISFSEHKVNSNLDITLNGSP